MSCKELPTFRLGLIPNPLVRVRTGPTISNTQRNWEGGSEGEGILLIVTLMKNTAFSMSEAALRKQLIQSGSTYMLSPSRTYKLPLKRNFDWNQCVPLALWKHRNIKRLSLEISESLLKESRHTVCLKTKKGRREICSPYIFMAFGGNEREALQKRKGYSGQTKTHLPTEGVRGKDHW